ncbi:MAG: hypothetical protein JSS56_08000 [Proteobacteria bacterium]|nr:hypothetical protein [Pseudomonadota bacterium]
MLIELMIALTLAGIAIAAAIAALMIARDAASAVREMTLLQQQASYALRTIGRQIRSAGSAELQASPAGAASFRFVSQSTAAPEHKRVHGTEGAPGASDSLMLIHTAPPLLPGFQRDCLGQAAAPGAQTQALFQVDAKGNLGCRTGSQSQPLIGGVASFRLRYRVLQGEQVRIMLASEVESAQLWAAVQSVEVCLELRGEQRLSAPVRQYIGCARQSTGDEGRMTLVTRKLFMLNASSEG